MCERLFNDKRVITVLILAWAAASAVTFYTIMALDDSPFLNFGPSDRTSLFGVKLDNWAVWWAVAVYTFTSTCIGAYSSDSIIPWITNTIQDHKTQYIPYSKFTCLLIIQVFTFYGVTQSIIGLFVALTQVDFMVIRLSADLLVNHYTTKWFLRHKKVDPQAYYAWEKRQKRMAAAEQDGTTSELDLDLELENTLFAYDDSERGTQHGEHATERELDAVQKRAGERDPKSSSMKKVRDTMEDENATLISKHVPPSDAQQQV